MKKILYGMMLALLTTALPAQIIDVAVARLKLTKVELVTQKEFRDRVSQLEKGLRQTLTAEQKTQLLDTMVSEKLILQAAEKAGMKVTDQEIITAAKAQIGQTNITDADLKRVIEQQMGTTWAAFLSTSRTQLMGRKFVLGNPKAQDLSKATVSDADVVAYYEENKPKFVNPDLVRVSHIFFDTKKSPVGTPAEIKKRAEDTQKAIASGQLTFEEAARTKSEDKVSSSKGGDLGFLPRNDANIQGIFGKDFITNLFRLKKGEVSSVIESNLGFHIVRITEKLDQKFLKIDDAISPQDTGTVRELIKAQLSMSAQQTALENLLAEIVDGLKKDSEISLYPDKM
ncbi:MAG: hypothetical protein A2Z96_03145 [Spirochaetes bacterium GWB1_48_6]|nr:MAG: hypothetical protein A2Z96_03145 [Spirochaetes bacterium GWB1_48_6]